MGDAPGHQTEAGSLVAVTNEDNRDMTEWHLG